jgi:hypothetical protein
MLLTKVIARSQRIVAIVATCLHVPNLMLMWLMKHVKLNKEGKKDQENMRRAMATLDSGETTKGRRMLLNPDRTESK